MSDDDFTRDGRPLRDWLPDLLGPDPATRRRAENAVSAMKWGVPVAVATALRYRPADFPAHQRAWGTAIAAAVNDPAFDGVAFVRAAIDRMRADARQRRERLALEDRLLDFDLGLDPDDPGPPPLTPEERTAATERLRAMAAEEKVGRLPNSSGTHTLHTVLEHAGPVLLRMPDDVRAGLRDDVCGRALAAALGELGAAAVAFAPDLMLGTDSYYGDAVIRHPTALAAVARADAATLSTLRDLARTGGGQLAFGAAEVLAAVGPPAVALVPSLVDDLMAAADALGTGPGGDGVSWLRFAAALDPGRPDVFDRAAAAARPAPRQTRRLEGRVEYEYDAVMHARGSAIDALGLLVPFAAVALPIVADAMDTFDEYDPDWGYERGDHGRAVDAIRRLAPAAPSVAAAVAVPALVRHLRDGDGDVDFAIVRALADLGPIAAAATAPLADLRAADPPDAEATAVAGGAPDEFADPIGWALHRVVGGQ